MAHQQHASRLSTAGTWYSGDMGTCCRERVLGNEYEASRYIDDKTKLDMDCI